MFQKLKYKIKKYSQGDSLGIKGDLNGDGFQNGGALVVDKNGKLLLEYRQEDAAEMVTDVDILKALKINQ